MKTRMEEGSNENENNAHEADQAVHYPFDHRQECFSRLLSKE